MSGGLDIPVFTEHFTLIFEHIHVLIGLVSLHAIRSKLLCNKEKVQ